MSLADTDRATGDPTGGDPGRVEVDARFLLANERTLLAWVRTALTLLAGGVALAQFAGRPVQTGIGVVLLLIGGATALIGLGRYRAAEQAIRAGRLPGTGRGPTVVVAGVIVVALALVVIHSLQV